MTVTRRSVDPLRPWIEGAVPNESGEQGLHCLYHEDNTRSASINFEKGVWYCQVCERGGRVDWLLDEIENNPELKPPTNGGGVPKVRSNGNGSGVKGSLSEGQVAGYHSALLANDIQLGQLIDRRGIDREIIKTFGIGWDSKSNAFTIPIRSADGDLLNVRRYQLDPPDDRRKIWSVPGHGTPVLFPGQFLNYLPDTVIICEGEMDAILTIQRGFDAVTRTGSAKTWRSEWNGVFRGKIVYICHDSDLAGQDGNRLVASALEGVAEEIYIVQLPYEITEKHGKDLTDFWMEGHSAKQFYELLFEAEPWGALADSPEQELTEVLGVNEVDLMQSFDAANVGQKMRTRVTITGKQTPTYIVPELVDYRCGMDAGAKCMVCPMKELEGHTNLRLNKEDPLILKFLDAADTKVADLLRAQVTPVKCGRLNIEVEESMSVEELHVRPSVEQYRINSEAGDYISRRIVSVGRHDTMPNNTCEIVGTIYPSPRTQHNEFQAWQVDRVETSVDKFEVTAENVKLMEAFRPRFGQSPLAKLRKISSALASSVTQVYGRDEMHALMDLTFHSIIAYTFDGKLEPRGWLDTLIVGDTRTGKTEAAKRLISWYGSGEYVSCEAATFAGVVGGLQQYGGKEWVVTWGAVPINDRRLVVLDEVSGLTTEQIAQMSSIRSSGEAQLTKIQSERTWARTRLLWLGNPRDGKTMAAYTYGAQAIRPLIGNNEDIARFDLAMSVATDEVSSEEINSHHGEANTPLQQEQFQAMISWCWSRKAEHVVWEPGAEALVYKLAIEMGDRYTQSPPLVQAANIRMKITRVAVAMAARLFSTDDTHELVYVTKAHVKDAVKFMNMLYEMPGFGYYEHSREQIQDTIQAAKNRKAVQTYLRSKPGLAKFLRSMGEFRRSDMEDMMNLTREEANATVNRLWEWRMVSRSSGAMVHISPELHDILREMGK